MDMDLFAEMVLEEVRKKADGAFSLCITKALKNNGVRETGIAAAAPDSGPCIILDGYFREYCHGLMETGTVSEIVFRQIMESMGDLENIRPENFQKWDVAGPRIRAKLINAGWNSALLGNVPHRMFLDLAVVYYIKVDGLPQDRGFASALVGNGHAGLWDKNEENLYQTAVANMRMDGPPLLEDMGTLLRGIMPGSADSIVGEVSGIYVLTNCHRAFGAAELLDENTLKDIGSRLGDDFVVLPSSINEVLVIPSKKAPSYSGLEAMVHEVNETQVEEKERLSGHVYAYFRDEGKLKIVA